ncbi:hypothetical protein [Prosthecobacter vanneervenii]|uniref:Uncharacterized protein n=1 Tax=Prosthecobacter vanneervenii TaxID=48466 RepID=A0A7W7Y8L3_9BACT|nr:hypothetical protein [Prosthecobacter vanneervenii]MBB5031651.1 hypothetical protein [Prosthecobacter vanneervenii]
MLNTRSTRIAAALLLALLFGWIVRAHRKDGTDTQPTDTPAPPTAIQEPPTQSVLNNE